MEAHDELAGTRLCPSGDDVRVRHPDDTLDDLSGAFPGYCFWRSRDDAGEPASYCATRIEPLTAAEEMAGRARTLIARSPGELRAQIEAQS